MSCPVLTERTAGCRTLADVRLTTAPESATAARRIVKALTRAWGITGIADRAELLTSELVTNAGKHAPGPDIHLVVSRRYDRLRVDVHDANPALPRIGCGDPMAEEGRGLLMAQSLADVLGWRPAVYGKTVFFELVAWPEGQWRR